MDAGRSAAIAERFRSMILRLENTWSSHSLADCSLALFLLIKRRVDVSLNTAESQGRDANTG